MLEDSHARSVGGRLFDIVRYESAARFEPRARVWVIRLILRRARERPSRRMRRARPHASRRRAVARLLSMRATGSRDHDGSRPIQIPATKPPKTRDTRKTRTATGRTATGDAVSEHR